MYIINEVWLCWYATLYDSRIWYFWLSRLRQGL